MERGRPVGPGNSMLYRKRKYDANFREANECRKTNDLIENVKKKKRKCLKCDKKFTSLGIWNRICEDCNKSNKSNYGMELYFGGGNLP